MKQKIAIFILLLVAIFAPYTIVFEEEDYSYHLSEADPKHPSNFVYDNALAIHDYDVGPDPEERSWSWFLKDYHELENIWQHLIYKFDSDYFPSDMEADVIQFKFIPLVENLIERVKNEDPPHAEEKLEILELRMKSLKALLQYYKGEEFDPDDYKEYQRYDSEFRDLVEEHEEIFD